MMISRCQRSCLQNIYRFHRASWSPLVRHGYPGLAVRYSSTERSKVEDTLKMLKEDLKRQQEEDARRGKLSPAKTDVKPALSVRVINELKHYYHGFRLLALEMKLSAKYLWRVARGATLTRRERQQLIRTVSDLFRLVPFSIFIIVPFMELALPIFIKLFPNMLPSTFQEASKEEEKIRKQVLVRVEMAKFLQSTIEEIALQRKTNKQGGSKAVEFTDFMKRLRSEGGYASNEDLFKYTQLFEDELTLDNLSMSQLRALCRVLLIQPLGTPEILRFQLKLKLRELKADDKQIVAEGGVDNLTSVDLQHAVRARGMRALGVSEERLRTQLRQWLELSLSDKVPPSLLLLSRILYLPEDLTFADRLKAMVSKLPDGIAEQTRQKLTEMEGGTVDHKARLDLIMNIEKAITEEKKANKEAEEKALEDAEKRKAAEKEKKTMKLEEEIADVEKQFGLIVETVQKTVDDLQESVKDTATPKAAKAETEAENIDPKVLASIEDILHGNVIKEAKHDITELKEKVIEHTEDLIEVGSLNDDYAESKVAKRLRNRVNAMISGVDTLVAKLEAEKRTFDELIADPAMPDAASQKEENLVRIKDLIESLHKLQKVTDEAKSKRIEEVLNAMDLDTDGKVDASLVLEVIELLGKHADVQLSAKQMAGIIEMLKKEDDVEALDKLNSESRRLMKEHLRFSGDQFPVRSQTPPSLESTGPVPPQEVRDNAPASPQKPPPP
uniref:Mitochondrial proton/calcium exchanger protein n=1 Tax=Steinernema glaseri TaxID=37863 RepID=A0A1I7ZY59_9BILA